MNTIEKSQFIAESLANTIKNQIAHFKKSNKKLIKSIDDSGKYYRLASLMTEAISESIKVMDEWEDKSFPELGGSMSDLDSYFDDYEDLDEFDEEEEYYDE